MKFLVLPIYRTSGSCKGEIDQTTAEEIIECFDELMSKRFGGGFGPEDKPFGAIESE